MNESILLIEDEEALRMTLEDRLRNEGYRVDQAADGAEGLEKATTLAYDLLILDLMLPQRNGLDLCREIRQAGLATPILILTARGQTVDKVVGLKLGADDYVTKPFEMMELMARIEVLLRRAHPKVGVAPNAQEFGEIHVDWKGTEVTRGGTPVALSAREFQLLRYFCEHPGQTLSRADILREVWGYKAETFTRTVDVHVASLRQKLESDPRKPALIMTVQGLGYKFVR
jgi:two-component system alkaline phosphatase synthesis response regulator PhoP